MSEHWRPTDVVDGPWSRLETYQERRRPRSSGAVTLLLGAVFVGVIAGLAWERWPAQPANNAAASAPAAATGREPAAVVPTRAPDAEDAAWQQRAEQPLSAPVEHSTEPSRAGSIRAPGARGIHVIDGDTF